MDTSNNYSRRRDYKSKSKSRVNKTEEKKAIANSKAVNAIFCVVDENMLKLIHTCTEAKQAWEIIQIGHERNTKI
jgi:hypothetical protein